MRTRADDGRNMGPFTGREVPMVHPADVRWDRVAAVAGGLVVLYGVGRVVSRVVHIAADEAIYRAEHGNRSRRTS